MKNIFSEMQRRNVFKTVLFYAAACWLLIQISETVLPIFGVPEWILRFMILVLAVGFIPVLLLSWVYEITPEGIKKESDVKDGKSISDSTGRKIGVATLGLVIAIGTLALFGPDPTTPLRPTTEELVQGVAVLPFDNVSDSEENAFFAVGVQEDILTHLSTVQDLRVISRTSVKGYLGSTLQMTEIAKQLGVSHLVEGSVRRVGNQVRVTVQLIDGATDKHIWAENYDRTLEDIFAIQSEVAQKIVAVIKQKLTTEEKRSLAQSPTTNTQAYELFHRANASVEFGFRSANAMNEPIRLMQLAVQEDPDYLQAWLKLTEYCGYAVWWTATEYTNCAENAVNQVARLAPESFELELAKGILAYRVSGDYQTAFNHLERAKNGLPNNVLAWTYLSYVARRLENWATAEQALLKVTQLDPLSERFRYQHLVTLQFSGDWQSSIAEAERLVAKFPDWQVVSFHLASLKMLYLGETDSYSELIKKLPTNLRWNYGNPFIEKAFESDDERIAWIKSIANVERGAQSDMNYRLGLLALIRGDEAKSREFLDIAAELWESLDNGNIEEQSKVFLIITANSKAHQDDYEAARKTLNLLFSRLQDQPDEIFRNDRARLIIDTYFTLNEKELAWAETKRALSSTYGITHWELKYDLMLRHYFKDLPEYQELVAGLEVGKPADYKNK